MLYLAGATMQLGRECSLMTVSKMVLKHMRCAAGPVTLSTNILKSLEGRLKGRRGIDVEASVTGGAEL